MLPLDLQLKVCSRVLPWESLKEKPLVSQRGESRDHTSTTALCKISVTFVPEFAIKAMGNSSFQVFSQIKKSYFPQPPKV